MSKWRAHLKVHKQPLKESYIVLEMNLKDV